MWRFIEFSLKGTYLFKSGEAVHIIPPLSSAAAVIYVFRFIRSRA